MVENYPKPWEQCPYIWKSEAQFWTFVRGVLRKGWSKHPVKLEFIKANRKRIINPVEKNRTRFPECWGMTCSICGCDTAQKDIEIDHIGEGSSFTGLHDAEKYVAHLFLVDYNSIRPVCKPCHKIENQRQRKGITFEEARLDKEVIAIMKEPVQDVIDFILAHDFNQEYNTNNEANRKEAVRAILKGVG
jgi:hypothetical protein